MDKRQTASAFHPVAIFNLGEFDRVTDMSTGKDYVWIDTSSEDYAFRPRDAQGPDLKISHADFERDLQDGRVAVFRDAYLPAKPEIRRRSGASGDGAIRSANTM